MLLARSRRRRAARRRLRRSRPRSKSTASSSSLPASTFEKSRMSLMIASSPSAAVCTPVAYSRCSAVEVGVEQQPAQPDDRVHRRADLVAHRREELRLRLRRARAPRRAPRRARPRRCSRSVTSREFTTKPRTLRSREQVRRRALHDDPPAVAVPQPERAAPTVAPGCSYAVANASMTRRLSSGCSRSVSLVPTISCRLVAEHPHRRRALVQRDRVLVEHGDEVGRVVHERAEPVRLALRRCAGAAAHADRERPPTADRARSRPARDRDSEPGCPS